jgi:hypothetical protein
MNKLNTIDIQYFGNIYWIKYLFECTHIKYFEYEPWRKMSFQNRTIIAGSNNLISLTVPIQGGRNKRQLLQDTIIDNRTKWQTIHWRSIQSCYTKAPYWEYYEKDLKTLFELPTEKLLNWNLEVLQWVVKALGLNVEKGHYSVINERLSDVQFEANLPKNYSLLSNEVRYTQVFEEKIGFRPNLSVLDLILCMGPRAKSLLADSNSQLPYYS